MFDAYGGDGSSGYMAFSRWWNANPGAIESRTLGDGTATRVYNFR